MRFQEHSLTPYRRHAPDCPLQKASELKCKCPLWAQGRVNGRLLRRSLGTRSFQKALEKINLLLNGKEGEPAPEEPAPAPKISDAIQDYLYYCQHNKRLKASTLVSYRDTLQAFEAFSAERLYRTVDQINLRLFELWQAERKITPKTMHKEFTHLASFCSRGVELGWIETNLAKKVKLPKADGVSTLPFKEAEAKAIQAACSRLGETDRQRGGYASYSAEQIDEERRYARALVLVLLSTGLRISDVVNLERSKVFTDPKGIGRLRIRTEKTGVVVTLALPEATLQALRNLPEVSHDLYFWKGGDERCFATACDRARRVIARLGAIAKVKDAHPHRFRDTWAKTALLNGESMRTVQLVLGHKSIRTTEEHYAPFVVEYQAMIDKATDAVAKRLIA
jgi:site-specific recombinase XerD